MRDEYDFSGSRPNPYAERVRRPVTVNIDVETIDYFKEEARRTGIPYQNIINMYLASAPPRRNRLHVRLARNLDGAAKDTDV